MTDNIKVPIDITGLEYKKLKENLDLFNKNVEKEDKLTFDEFISLVFETASLTEKLDFKIDYLNSLKAEVKELEEELSAKYSTGLKKDNDEVIESRKQILKDSSDYIDGLYWD